ncbi:MAG TPA: hypothetical protein VJL59_08075 [Anaerolineales bacterium]|nr:hypothetical protein [Anaerolineales bacterium]
MPLSALANLLGDRLHALPLAIVYLTDRCNSRCVMCDYRQFGQTNLSPDRARGLAAEFDRRDIECTGNDDVAKGDSRGQTK